jgi:hypothetical protein
MLLLALMLFLESMLLLASLQSSTVSGFCSCWPLKPCCYSSLLIVSLLLLVLVLTTLFAGVTNKGIPAVAVVPAVAGIYAFFGIIAVAAPTAVAGITAIAGILGVQYIYTRLPIRCF